MRAFTRSARYLVPGVLVIVVMSLGKPCVAQEVGAPAGGDVSDLPGVVFAPGGFVGLFAPLNDRIAINPYGFYYVASGDLGEVKVPIAMVDVPIRTTKFLTITPSYLYYQVPPPNDLNEASGFPGGVPETFKEHQLRIDGTVRFSIRKFEIADRNMYVRRFLPTDEINRYRQRIGVGYPLAVNGRIWKAFASYEAFYDSGKGWNKNRVGLLVTLPVHKHVQFQPSYIWESNRGFTDISYLQFGLIFSTR
jgi:Protein of unknown function (DUF2490)